MKILTPKFTVLGILFLTANFYANYFYEEATLTAIEYLIDRGVTYQDIQKYMKNTNTYTNSEQQDHKKYITVFKGLSPEEQKRFENLTNDEKKKIRKTIEEKKELQKLWRWAIISRYKGATAAFLKAIEAKIKSMKNDLKSTR